MWRKIQPKSTFVEKKWQISGLREGLAKNICPRPKDDDGDADDEDGDSVVRAACELADQLTLDNCHGGTGRPWAGCSHSCKTVTRCGLIEEVDFSWIFKSISSVPWKDLYEDIGRPWAGWSHSCTTVTSSGRETESCAANARLGIRLFFNTLVQMTTAPQRIL